MHARLGPSHFCEPLLDSMPLPNFSLLSCAAMFPFAIRATKFRLPSCMVFLGSMDAITMIVTKVIKIMARIYTDETLMMSLEADLITDLGDH